MFTLFFTGGDVFDFASAAKSDTSLYARYFRKMLENRIYFAPSQFEAAFLSFAHGDEDIDKTIRACEKTIRTLAKTLR
jgi:glutamate-1-semialdehyde 2,1-aminomutase